MKQLIILSLILISTNVFCSPIISIGPGYSLLSNKALDDQSGSAKGLGYNLKLGTLNGEHELGLYFGSGSFQVTADHDNVDNTIEYTKSDFGIYTTYYRSFLYFELGFGKTVIEEKLDSSLSSAQENILKDIYNIQDDKIESYGTRFLIGTKVMNFTNSILTLYLEQTFLFSTDHRTFSGGAEIKILI